MVMLGYSDGSKVTAARRLGGGACVRVEVLDVARDAGIRIVFFHGRGGTVAVAAAGRARIIASPRGSVDGRLQHRAGQVVHRKYGIRSLALPLARTDRRRR
jgi:phosphoenolpyruvate carboxylase